jgi:hypothetical protein
MEIKIFGYEMRVELIIACVAIGMLMGLVMFCDCFQYNLIEGMTTKHAAAAAHSAVNKKPSSAAVTKPGKEGFKNLSNNDLHIDDSYTMGWVQTAKRYASGMGNENKLNTYKDNVGTPVPLPEGELFFFADNKFKPECCPSTYSDSTGCACLSQAQVDYVNQRGGNRTLGPTEF